MEQQQTWSIVSSRITSRSPWRSRIFRFRRREAINVLRGNIQLSGANLKADRDHECVVANEGKSGIAFRLTKSLAVGLKKRNFPIWTGDISQFRDDVPVRNERPGAGTDRVPLRRGSDERYRLPHAG
ncbi:MAG: hypothetical protein ACLTSZ_17375 [Lachnospiraceae bacterium]